MQDRASLQVTQRVGSEGHDAIIGQRRPTDGLTLGQLVDQRAGDRLRRAAGQFTQHAHLVAAHAKWSRIGRYKGLFPVLNRLIWIEIDAGRHVVCDVSRECCVSLQPEDNIIALPVQVAGKDIPVEHMLVLARRCREIGGQGILGRLGDEPASTAVK